MKRKRKRYAFPVVTQVSIVFDDGHLGQMRMNLCWEPDEWIYSATNIKQIYCFMGGAGPLYPDGEWPDDYWASEEKR